MSSQYTDNDYEKQKEEGANTESEEQSSDLTPIDESPWTDEKVSEPGLEPDAQTTDDPSAETLSKGTPSWAAMPDEKLVEDGNTNPDLVEMDEIHEMDELDRLDELDEVNSREEVNEDYETVKPSTPVVALSSLTGSITSLLNQEESEKYWDRWNKIQVNFVDDPKVTVQQADDLVSELIEEIKRKFIDELNALETQWKSGPSTTTEDLRVTLQLYRSFFNRLVGKK